MHSAPKYSKIELHFKESHNDNMTHEDCGMFITGELLVVVEDRQDSIENSMISEGIIYKLTDIEKYITHKT